MSDQWERVSAWGLEPHCHTTAYNALKPADSGTAAPNEIEVQAAREWLRAYAKKTVNIRKTYTSYGMKHLVERRAAVEGRHQYVSNGAFIEAALAEGYKMERAARASVNAFFNMAPSSKHAWDEQKSRGVS